MPATKRATTTPTKKPATPASSPTATAQPAEAAEPMAKVKLGDSVLYHLKEGPRAATVASVVDADSGRCNLAYLSHDGKSFPELDVPYSEDGEPGTWSHRE